MASTSEVYGDPLVHPQTEEYWGNVNPVGPRGVYDEAKRFSEAITMAYHTHHGLDTRIVRIFNTYGPRMRPNDGRVVSNFIVQALQRPRPHHLRRRLPDPKLHLRRRRDPRVLGAARQRRHDHRRTSGTPNEFTVCPAGRDSWPRWTDTGSTVTLPRPAGRRPDTTQARHHQGAVVARLVPERAVARGPRAHDRVLRIPARQLSSAAAVTSLW